MIKIYRHLNHKKRKKLGQHFLISNSIAKHIVSAIEPKDTETVFELGTGHGILTAMLCQKARHVTTVDVDSDLVESAKKTLSEFKNLQICCGDGFALMQKNSKCHNCDTFKTTMPLDCDVFVSNLPYSQSRRAIEQLASANFERCIIMIQKEFASKIFAGTAPDNNCADRRAISVIAQYCFDMRVVMNVSARCFEPNPDVNSVVVILKRKNKLDHTQIKMINKIFSYRRKRLSSILRIVCNVGDSSYRICDDDDKKCIFDSDALRCQVSDMLGRDTDTLRLDDLTVSDVMRLIDVLLLLLYDDRKQ